MASETGFWGKAVEKAKQEKVYILDRLATIGWALLLCLIVSVVFVRIVGLDDAYGTLVQTFFVCVMLAVFGQNLSHRYKQYVLGQDALRQKVGLLHKIVREESGLLSMAQVLKDLEKRLPVEAGDDVVLEHLGIHMEHFPGRHRAAPKAIAAREGVARVHYRLLMLRRPDGRNPAFRPQSKACWTSPPSTPG